MRGFAGWTVSIPMIHDFHDILVQAKPVYLTRSICGAIDEAVAQRRGVDLLVRDFSFDAFGAAFIPELRELGRRVFEALENDKPALVIRNLGLCRMSPIYRDFLLMLFCGCIAHPTPTDRRVGKVVWEVTPRQQLERGHVPTISETTYEAEFHTDSAYRAKPERFVALLCVQPSIDGGGCSTLLEGNVLLERLSGMKDGKQCERVMREPIFPFRVPDSFTAEAGGNPEVVIASVVGDVPRIRYRRDSIEQGFALMRGPDDNLHECKRAIEVFSSAIQQCPSVTFPLERDDLFIVNNHVVLHGRTAFSDPNRLLLRVRME